MLNKNDFQKSITFSLNESSKIFIDEIESIIINIRWITTLVLAEIGGLTAYRDLSDQTTLSLPFAFVILLLSIALLVFIFAIIYSRNNKTKILMELKNSYGKLVELLNKKDKTEEDYEKEAKEIINNTNENFLNKKEYSKNWEIVGIVLFTLASIIAAINIFISEIINIF